MFKVTISGDYRTGSGANGDIVDFEGVVGIMPECDREMVQSHVMNRYLGTWIKNDKRYPARFASRRTTHIDNIEVVPGIPDIIGKDIKQLDWMGLQDLAVMKNLLRIPLIHASDLRSAREIAYLEYSDKVLDSQIKTKAEGYDYNKLPALIIMAEGIAKIEPKLSNEEALAEAEEVDCDFTMAELRQLAKDKGMTVKVGTSKKDLYALLFPKKG